jgi:hypothetical protein
VIPHSYGSSFAAVHLRGAIFEAAKIDAAANTVDRMTRNRIGR